MKTLGIILVVLGLLGFAWPSIKLTFGARRFSRLGRSKLTVKKHETVSLSPFLG